MKPHGSYMNEHYNELVLLDSTCDRTIIICTTSNCDKTSNILVKTILIIVIAKIVSC